VAAPDGFAQFLCDQLAALGHVTVRRMFGGAGVYCDGLMFGLVAGEVLYFRVDAGNGAAFAAEGLEPFTYQARGRDVVLPYRRVPERLFDDPDEMTAWAREALAAARRAAARRRPRHGRSRP